MGFGVHRRVYSHGSERFGSNVCGCLCVILCCGPLLFLGGVASLASFFTDSRSPSITKYNTAVDAWTGTGPGSYASAIADWKGTRFYYQFVNFNEVAPLFI